MDLFTLEEGRWVLSSASLPDEVLRLEAIGCEIPVGELYEKIEFPAQEAPQPTTPGAASNIMEVAQWGRNGFDGIDSLCRGVPGSELP